MLISSANKPKSTDNTTASWAKCVFPHLSMARIPTFLFLFFVRILFAICEALYYHKTWSAVSVPLLRCCSQDPHCQALHDPGVLWKNSVQFVDNELLSQLQFCRESSSVVVQLWRYFRVWPMLYSPSMLYAT